MVYIVNYDIKSEERKDAFLNAAKTMGDVQQYLPHALFVDSKQEQRVVYEELKKMTNEDDLFVVVSAPLSNMLGWLTSSVVDWLKLHNS